MSLAITELELTDVNTISIPTDAILMLSLLIVFALLGYFFHNILNTQTNQFIEKVDDHSHLELVKEKLADQSILESTRENQERVEKPRIKKLNFLPPSKWAGVVSMSVIAIGGASLVAIQNSYQRVNTSQIKIKKENQSAKSLLSMAKIKSSNKFQTKIKKISYVDPLLSNNNSSKKNNFSLVKQRQTEDFFSF